ncbi:DUF6924 domain-containing protein [Occallatibacter savannae]|uniref:DUF6924 domain-containing protein n=1 Tax=Occallatibacter savannae TaxID=1002691 RepID=UPI000D69957D|nr:hypothetical protein [Occallatibacter savannae]
MELLPKTENSPVVRTDFDDDSAWTRVRELIRQPISNEFGDTFRAYVTFVDDPAFRDLSEQQLLERVPPDFGHSFLMVVDRAAMSEPEFPVLIIDLYDGRGRSFRAIPSQIQAIENNLSIANMDFEEFADYVGEDGIFRGHPV